MAGIARACDSALSGMASLEGFSVPVAIQNSGRRDAYPTLHRPNKRGRTYYAPHHRHRNALKGTLFGAPLAGRASKRRPLIEISGFVMDSSRSYAIFSLRFS